MSKKAWIIVSSILAAVVIGLQVYEILVKGVVDTNHIIRTLIIILALIASFIKKNSGYADTRANKRAFKRAYGDLIGNAFEGKRALEKTFYAALHNLNNKKPNAALDKLEDLKNDCETADERFAVAFFSGMCYDDLEQYASSVKCYEQAAGIKHHATPFINAGFCFLEMGEYELAIDVLTMAVSIKAEPIAYHNLADAYFEMGNYELAIENVEEAIKLNPKYDDSYFIASVSHAMLGNEEKYKEYLHRYAALGGDVELTKRYVEMQKFEEE